MSHNSAEHSWRKYEPQTISAQRDRTPTRKSLQRESIKEKWTPLIEFPPRGETEETEDNFPQYHVMPPGNGYIHPLVKNDVIDRIAELPSVIRRSLASCLDHIVMPTHTRKMDSDGSYGIQWGSSLYLFPMEENREEYFFDPSPLKLQETKRFGARWSHNRDKNSWTCRWTPEGLIDFYRENVLIHELGHLLDKRNNSYIDRERFAEAFAQQYGHTLDHFEDRKKPHRDRKHRRHHK